MFRHLYRMLVFMLAMLTAAPLIGICGEKQWPADALRGINVGNTSIAYPKSDPKYYITEEVFLKLMGWHINVIRIFIDVDKNSKWWRLPKDAPIPPTALNNPLIPYQDNLKGLEIALDLAAKHGIYVIVTLGNVVGRQGNGIYKDNNCTRVYNEVRLLWKHIISKHKTNPYLLAYDILNEPRGDELKTWQDLMLPSLVEQIRRMDQDTYIMVEPGPYGKPDGFKTLRPINAKKIVYSFHFYAPHRYTYQGIGKKNKPLAGKIHYPGMVPNYPAAQSVDGKQTYWDLAQLERYAQPAIEFQRKHNAHLFVGEFSVIRFAPGAAKWLQDVISIFEKYKWDWCYHSYRAFNGWNPTYPPVISLKGPHYEDGGHLTERLKVLIAAWAKNKGPDVHTAYKHEKGS